MQELNIYNLYVVYRWDRYSGSSLFNGLIYPSKEAAETVASAVSAGGNVQKYQVENLSEWLATVRSEARDSER